MATPRKVPFRDGAVEEEAPAAHALAAPAALAATAAPQVLLADVSEFQPWINDPVYLQWSKAIIIRCAYGDQHDDKAWYNGQRRDLLHSGGARFLGIYQYLVAGQDGAAQADAFHALVGAIRPGEVFIADFEEGSSKDVLTAWYNQMIVRYGSGIHPYLWTYTGLYFGQRLGVLPVEWIAAYGSGEPSSPHKLWQFTSSYPVPGVGTADCSVFHGTMDQLAALAVTVPVSTWGPPRNLTVKPGLTSVELLTCDPPAGFHPDHYEVYVHRSYHPDRNNFLPTYPRWMRQSDLPKTFGGLTPANGVNSGDPMTLRVFACDATGKTGQPGDAYFVMP